MVSMTDFSDYCRHEMSQWKFSVSSAGSALEGLAIAESSCSEEEVAIVVAGDIKTVKWDMLTDITYQKKYNKEYEMYFNYPVFGKKIQGLKNAQIVISGYAIPLDMDTYVLSKYVFASCFFCGGAGPETIMGITFKGKPQKKLRTDDYITLTGTFRLNEEDVNEFMYHIDEATFYQQ